VLLRKVFTKSLGNSEVPQGATQEARMFSRDKVPAAMFTSRECKRRSLLTEFAGADDGVVAIEFAMIGLPFIALMLAIFQTAIVLFAAQALESATEVAARQIMTGQAQGASMTQAQFRNLVCPTASGGTQPSFTLPKVIDCSKLIIDVRTASNFSSTDTTKTLFTTPSQAQFNPGGPNSINVVRVMYQLPPYLTILGGGANNIFGISGGATTNVIMGTAVFQTEPYGS
jgi:Flp pilus assembly protein TadG